MRLSPVLYELVRAFSKNANPCDNERTRAAVININAGLRFGWVSDRTHQQLARDDRAEPSRRTSAMGVAGAPERIDSHKAREKLPARSTEVERPRLRCFRRRVTPPCFRLHHNSIDFNGLFTHPNQHSISLLREKHNEETRRALEGESRLMALYMWVI